MLAAHKWYYLKYDDRDHAISHGVYTDPNSYSAGDMQMAVTNNLTYTTYWFERRNAVYATQYYTNNTFPNANITPLAYAYYDNYDADMNGTANYSKVNMGLPGESNQTTDSLRGVLTMIRKTTVGTGITSGIWFTQNNMYDNRGRIIQVQSNNQITTGTSDFNTTVYDFSGAPIQNKVIKVTGSTTTTVLTTMGYDPMHRPITIDQSYNGGSTVRIASYMYNELGQLVDKKLHSTNGGSTYLQSVDYRYNIRGQLLSINNSKLSLDTGTGSGYTNDDSNDLFGIQYVYDQADSNIGTTGLFDGRLAAVKWMSKNASGVSSNERSYKYTYDARNRLVAANYAERTASATTAFNVNTGGFDESGIKYDENGNILTLNRNMSTVGPTTPAVTAIDNLTYTYDTTNPNRLLKMTDGTGSNYTGYGFRNMTGVTSTATYSYDGDGNMTADPYKGLTMTYNDLNKTDKITITTATNRYITYTYDADGNILRKQAFDNNVLQTTTDYIDGMVFITAGTGTPTLSYFSSPEGRW